MADPKGWLWRIPFLLSLVLILIAVYLRLRLKESPVFHVMAEEHEVEIQADKWTVLTADRTLSAQFEHTLVVTRSGCEVLTRRARRLANSEIFPSPFLVKAS